MQTQTRKLARIAMLSAIAYVVVAVGRIPVVLFLKYDPKDVIIAVGGFLYGPLSAFLISVTVSFAEMVTISDTGLIGAVMNVIATCAFACTAAVIYKKNRTIKGAAAGLLVGWLFMTVIMLLWNYLITPFYMGQPREAVAALLIPAILPFNLLKGGLNAGITMLLYKPITTALRRANMIPSAEKPAAHQPKVNIGVILVSVFVVISCILFMLVLQGKI